MGSTLKRAIQITQYPRESTVTKKDQWHPNPEVVLILYNKRGVQITLYNISYRCNRRTKIIITHII